jgi:hypothetical protein
MIQRLLHDFVYLNSCPLRKAIERDSIRRYGMRDELSQS